jgi:hypothetical protein
VGDTFQAAEAAAFLLGWQTNLPYTCAAAVVVMVAAEVAAVAGVGAAGSSAGAGRRTALLAFHAGGSRGQEAVAVGEEVVVVIAVVEVEAVAAEEASWGSVVGFDRGQAVLGDQEEALEAVARPASVAVGDSAGGAERSRGPRETQLDHRSSSGEKAVHAVPGHSGTTRA